MSLKENNFMVVRFGYREHRVTLDESLKTRVYISCKTFDKMIKSDTFDYYGYDPRCHQYLWLNAHYNWLFIELVCHENE